MSTSSRGYLRPLSCTYVLALLLVLPGSATGQTIFRDASSQLPPEPPIVTPGGGGRPDILTNTSDADFIDIDGDGDLDLFVADGTPDIGGRPNRLLLNDGRGNFSDVSDTNLPPSANVPFGPGPANSVGADIGDVDGDGDQDIVVANLGNNQLLLNDGTGVFTDASTLLPPPPRGPLMGPLAVFNNISVDVGFVDVDRDGDLDLYFTNELPPIPGVGPGGSPNLLYIQNADGTFSDESAQRLPTALDATINFVTLDVEGDGDLDILEANIGQNQLLLNDGNGFFTLGTAGRLPVDSSTTRAIALGDLDGDGDLDYVTANSNAEQNQVYLNDGVGVFTEAPNRLPKLNDTSSDVELFDVDFDGDLDVLFANSALRFTAPGAPPAPVPAPNVLYLNDGRGFFTEATDRFFPATASTSFELETGDVNGDGLVDVVVSNGNGADENLFIRVQRPRTPAFGRQLSPLVKCIKKNVGGNFTAVFGYRNPGRSAVYLPIGPRNRFTTPLAVDNGQPVVFLPGGSQKFPSELFEVDFRFVAVWVLNGRVAVATKGTPRCSCEDKRKSAPKEIVGSLEAEMLVGPNPFSSWAQVAYTLPREASVTLRVFNVAGQLVTTLFSGAQSSGTYRFELNGEVLRAGAYYVRLDAVNGEETVRLSTQVVKQ